MRRILILMMTMGLLLVAAAPAASAKAAHLTPLPNGQGHWIAGAFAGDEVDGSSGKATVNNNGATVTVKTTGLEPGDTYTMWIVYFNDGPDCDNPEPAPPAARCGGGDLAAGNGGVNYGDGKVVGGNGNATFSARLNVGDGPDRGPRPPDQPGVMPYEPSDSPDFHIVLRSHGPKIPGEVSEQIHTFDGGCETNTCVDTQLFVFES